MSAAARIHDGSRHKKAGIDRRFGSVLSASVIIPKPATPSMTV